MEREIIYILAIINITVGFVLFYGRRSPYRGRRRKR